MSAVVLPEGQNPEVAPLFLTQILLGYENAVRLLKIRDSYDWHQLVWQAFAGRAQQSRDFLIRVDHKEEGYRVLILSRTRPSKPDWCPSDCFGTKSIPPEYFAHPEYRFSLLANPTRKLRVDNPDGTRKKNGRRVPISQREELILWLQRKGEAGGFSVHADTLRTIPRGREFFHKAGAHGTHTAVEFQGMLSVNDPALFFSTVTKGIGSAKAFGFGLLALTPVS